MRLLTRLLAPKSRADHQHVVILPRKKNLISTPEPGKATPRSVGAPGAEDIVPTWWTFLALVGGVLSTGSTLGLGPLGGGQGLYPTTP